MQAQVVQTFYTLHHSPIGPLLIAGDTDAIRGISFTAKAHSKNDHSSIPDPGWQAKNNPLFDEARRQLDAYFDGTLTEFNLSLAPNGTAFQMQVWQALLAIPYGLTCSYADIAEKINNPQACRAVGAANNANPITIVIPCHRVIGASGELVGYGGGLARKTHLLKLENATCVKLPQQQSLF